MVLEWREPTEGQRPTLYQVDRSGAGDGGAQYRCQFVRYTPGTEEVWLVNVSYDGHPIPGSLSLWRPSCLPDPSKGEGAFCPGSGEVWWGTRQSLPLTPKVPALECLGPRWRADRGQDRVTDNGDGPACLYLPTEPGDHLVNILFEEVHILACLFRADIQMPFDP
ncbi:filamin-B-like isoform X1 [Lates japonicus]|uniref:Filamin-B-like isoform X1 n=1 Tax=Lates japonicus TaxID=270547 RepID=A0AAD3RJH0_LATJO|nr:filamin-B-like isoform X1 [Lates japonicus]